MADALIGALNGDGTTALLLDGQAGQAGADRLIGFRERLRSAPSIDIQKEIDLDGESASAFRRMQEYSERFPRLDAWVALDNWPLRDVAAVPSILPPHCQLVTSTPLPGHWERIRDRTCAALIGVRYERIAEAALRMCTAVIQREPLQSGTYLAPPITVTAKNLRWYQSYWFESLERPADLREFGDSDPGG